ncbi:MAG: endo-1,4-beta-xylanase [Armatimonadetes bacterium]|nr:endo-1,4-beta-xylanase [Armatimonadota bacterium]
MYLPRIDLESPGVLYVDGAQIESPELIDFAPKSSIELGLSPDGEDSLYFPGEKVELDVLATNSDDTSRKLKATVALTDYDDKCVDERSGSFVAPAKATGKASFDLSQKRLGYYRAEVRLLDEQGSEIDHGRWAYAVIPRPPGKADVKFGICMERENLDVDVPLAKALGFGSVRLHNNMLWANIEKDKGKFDWSWEEAAVQAVHEAGLEPLAIIDTFPSWAWDSRKDQPKDIDAWSNMVREMVGTWKSQVHDWEIINEPVAHYLPEVYFPFLQAAYKAAKEADPKCNVVGICGFHNDDKMIPYVFEQGGLQYMDVLSMHPYAVFGNTPERGLPPIWESIGDRMRQDGTEKPVWSTEFGFRATDWRPTPDIEGAALDLTDEKTQADYAVRTEVLSFAHGVKRFYYFMLASHLYSGTYTNSMFAGDSLASPKKVVTALAGLTQRLSGLDFVEQWDCGSDNLYACRFVDKRKQAIVLWSPLAPNSLLISTDTPAIRLYDVAGNQIPAVFEGGLLKVSLSPAPIYLEVPVGRKVTPHPIVSLSPLPELDPEKSRSVLMNVRVHNPSGRDVQGRLSVSVPEGWKATPSSMAVKMPPGTRRESAFTIVPAPNYAESVAKLRFELKDATSHRLIASADRVATFRLAPPPKPRHTVWLEAESATEKSPEFNVLKAERAYGGKFLHIESAMKPTSPDGALHAKIPFRANEEGSYLVMMLGNPLNVAYMSPLWWRVDEGDWRRAWDLPQQGEIWSPWPQNQTYRFFGRTDLGAIDLQAGDHALCMRIDERRQIDACFTTFIDAFALLKQP